MEIINDPSITYKLSRDYNLLFELGNKGHKVVCFVDYSYKGDHIQQVWRDVVRLTFHGENYTFGVRGMGYDSLPETKEEFIKDCESSNLEFIEPNI